MTTAFTEQDLILLNAYLDGELTDTERAELEARLAEDELLRAELESLRVTAALLGMAQRLSVPRNFTLDPAVYGRPARSGWWASLGLGGFPAWAAAGITVLVVLVCLGAMVMRGGVRMATQAPSVAQYAPAAAATAAPKATQAEAPPAPAAKLGMEGVQDGQTTAAAAAAMPPLPTPTPTAPTVGGGVGGGPSENPITAEASGATSAAAETSLAEQGTILAAESTATPAAAPSLLPTEAPPQPLRSYGEAGSGNTAPSPSPTETQLKVFTAVVPTPTPTPTWIEGQVAGAPVKLVLLVAGGAVVLIGGLAIILIILKRRSR